MSRLSEFFLNSNSNVVLLELVEFKHPNFSRTHRVVRNKTDGVTVRLEDDTYAIFDYYPLKITPSGSSLDLDFGFKIEFGDLGEALPQELDLVAANNGFSIRPEIIFRTYRSDDLESILQGPLYLECSEFTFTKTGAAFEAKAPSLNVSRTGEIYTFQRFPMLRGFL